MRPRVVLSCLVLAYLTLAAFYAWVLVSHAYESQYLGLGTLALRGELNLYQDELTGQWVPLPFYVYGVTQLVAGPSVLGARIVAVAIGLAVLVLVFVIAARWAGLAAAAVAGGLFCTNGLVLGYYATAHFSPLVAAVHLIGLYVLFCTRWPRRDVIAMVVFSVLFVTKPHYWPTLPFVLLYLLVKAESLRVRLALVAAAVAIPLTFFAWDPRHLKLLAFVPVLREWVKPLGFQSFMLLQADTGHYDGSDYVNVPVAATVWGQIARVVVAAGFLVKRYAVWLALLGILGWLASRRSSRPHAVADRWWTGGPAFTFWLFWYLVAWQFVAVGPHTKQAFAYVGAIAPLLAIVLGCLFAAVWQRLDVPGPLRVGAGVAVILAMLGSPFIHRAHGQPRTVSVSETVVSNLRQAGARLGALIPPADKDVFLLGDLLPLHLAGRHAYLRQSHQVWEAFTTMTDPAAYARTGMWGPAEIERWLGAEAKWAIIQPSVIESYRRRAPYRQPVLRIEALLAQNFRLVDTLQVYGSEVFKVYRRKD